MHFSTINATYLSFEFPFKAKCLLYCFFFLLLSILIHFPLKSPWYKMAIFPLEVFSIEDSKFLKFSSC